MNAVKQLAPVDLFPNALKLFANCEDNVRAVRVIDGIASITDGKTILIRRRLTNPIPDGFYDVKLSGELSPVKDVYSYRGFPDLLPFRPSEKSQMLCKMTNVFIGEYLMRFVREIYDNQGTVGFNKESVYMVQNPEKKIEYPFNLSERTMFKPHLLTMILTEMIQYPEIAIFRNIREEDGDRQITSVAFGTGWDSCGIIAPLNPNSWYY